MTTMKRIKYTYISPKKENKPIEAADKVREIVQDTEIVLNADNVAKTESYKMLKKVRQLRQPQRDLWA